MLSLCTYTTLYQLWVMCTDAWLLRYRTLVDSKDWVLKVKCVPWPPLHSAESFTWEERSRHTSLLLYAAIYFPALQHLMPLCAPIKGLFNSDIIPWKQNTNRTDVLPNKLTMNLSRHSSNRHIRQVGVKNDNQDTRSGMLYSPACGFLVSF